MKFRRVLSAMVIFATGAGAGYFTALVRTQPEVRQYCAHLIVNAEDRVEAFLNRFIPTSAHANTRGPSKTPQSEAPPESAETKSAYVRESLILSDVSTKSDPAETQTALVSGKIKNNGNRVLDRVLLTTYFMEAGKIVFEVSVAPLGQSTLKPDEIREFAFKVKNIPSGTEAHSVRASITDISFAQ